MRAGLADISGASGFEDREEIALFRMNGEDQDPCRKTERADLTNRFEPAAGHREIDDHHGRLELPGRLERRGTIRRLADNLHIWLAFKECLQTRADDAVVIGKNDGN